MKVWITQYALTRGIFPALVTAATERGWVSEAASTGVHYAPGDWHATRAEAVAAARKARDTRLATLRRQIERLEAIEFNG